MKLSMKPDGTCMTRVHWILFTWWPWRICFLLSCFFICKRWVLPGSLSHGFVVQSKWGDVDVRLFTVPEMLEDSVYTALTDFQTELHEKPNTARTLGSRKTITFWEKGMCLVIFIIGMMWRITLNHRGSGNWCHLLWRVNWHYQHFKYISFHSEIPPLCLYPI